MGGVSLEAHWLKSRRRWLHRGLPGRWWVAVVLFAPGPAAVATGGPLLPGVLCLRSAPARSVPVSRRRAAPRAGSSEPSDPQVPHSATAVSLEVRTLLSLLLWTPRSPKSHATFSRSSQLWARGSGALTSWGAERSLLEDTGGERVGAPREETDSSLAGGDSRPPPTPDHRRLPGRAPALRPAKGWLFFSRSPSRLRIAGTAAETCKSWGA